MPPEVKSMSINLFHKMIWGNMSLFTAQFGKLVWETIPIQFLGHKEFMYLAYMCAFFTAASDASTLLNHKNKSPWEVQVERCAGIDCLDLIMQRIGDDTGSIHELKREPLSLEGIKEGYSESQRRQLTKKAQDALVQLETRQYRASMRGHVTRLREYGVAFLGPYCAVVGRSVERAQGGNVWQITHTYDSAEGEERRKLLYTSARGPQKQGMPDPCRGHDRRISR